MSIRIPSKTVLSCAVLLLATACDLEFITGPAVVRNGESVRYQILLKSQGAASNATVYLTGYVPVGWTLTGYQFQASIGGGISGDLTVHQNDPGVIIPTSPVPAGHRPIYLSAGPFPAILDTDVGTALLSFTAAGATRDYTMTFWAGRRQAGEPDEQGDPRSFALSALASDPPGTVFADGLELGTAERWSRRGGVDTTTVAYYPFDGDTDDKSDFDNNGTAVGDPVFGSDRFGRPNAALLFDGVDDQVIVADSPSLDLTDELTLAAWVKPAATGNRYVLGKINPVGGGFVYSLDYLTWSVAGRLRSGFVEHQATGYLPLEADQWQLLVFTWDGTDMVCSVDGVVEGHFELTGTTILTGDGDVEIGSYDDARFRGAMDDVLIMNRALTHREVLQLLQ